MKYAFRYAYFCKLFSLMQLIVACSYSFYFNKIKTGYTFLIKKMSNYGNEWVGPSCQLNAYIRENANESKILVTVTLAKTQVTLLKFDMCTFSCCLELLVVAFLFMFCSASSLSRHFCSYVFFAYKMHQLKMSHYNMRFNDKHGQ